MRLDELDYDLPKELIAQEPVRPRDASRMLVLHRASGKVEHRGFRDLLEYLSPQDVVVMNNTRVIPARLFGRREGDEEGKEVEVLLLRQEEGNVWEALVRPGKKAKAGTRLIFEQGLWGEVQGTTASGGRKVAFGLSEREASPVELKRRLLQIGRPPLPPYITAKLRRAGDYQTVYAKRPGSAAAPTAGMHFTPRMLRAVEAHAQLCYLTLHIGPATFRPIRTDIIEDHPMPPEAFWLNEETVSTINRVTSAGGHCVAVGTSTCRVLESCIDESGVLKPQEGETSLYIKEGFEFRATDVLLTNFHLPKSTNLLLVMAFAGREKLLTAYEEAVEMKYRFFSFGDAMLIV